MKLVWTAAFAIALFAQHSAQAACATTQHVEWTGPMGGHWTVDRCLKATGGERRVVVRKIIHAPRPRSVEAEARYTGGTVRDLSPPQSLLAPGDSPCERNLAGHFGHLSQDMRWFCDRYK